MKKVLAFAAAAMLSTSPALAQTFIDFETTGSGAPTEPLDGTAVGATYSNLGLTFTGADFFGCGGGCPSPANGSFISGGSPDFNSAFTVSFLNAISGFSAVNVSGSAFTASAFGSGGVLLGTDSASDFLETVSFAFGGITSIQFTPNGQFGVDDFRFTQEGTGAVPEPATWAMMLMGFGAIGAAFRRRKRPATSMLTA